MTTRTLQQLAKEAIAVQNASNLSGVVHGWSDAIADLRQLLPPDFCTDRINHHPINRLWASKVHDLTGMGLSDMDSFSEAFAACLELSSFSSKCVVAVLAVPGV